MKKELKQQINTFSQYDTDQAKGYVMGLYFALNLLQESEDKLLSHFKTNYQIKPIKIDCNLWKLNDVTLTTDQLTNEMKEPKHLIKASIYGYKYLFYTSTDKVTFEGLIKTFMSERKRPSVLNFENFCKIKFDIDVRVIRRYNEYKKVKL